MMETGLTKNKIITVLSRSAHGKLHEYVADGLAATKQEPEFMAHLIAWNRLKGQVRDSQVALPVVSLCVPIAPELAENSFAHIATLGPRQLLMAYRFVLEVRPAGRQRQFDRLVAAWLREAEANAPRWERTALQHRRVLKELYSLSRTKPADFANVALFGRHLDKTKAKYRAGSLFEVVAHLKDMSPTEAAGAIITRKIPFLIAVGALGKAANETDVVLALIKSMSATELVTNTKMLEKMGIKTIPALRGAYEEGLKKVSSSGANVFKTTRAAEAVTDAGLKNKLQGAQERQIEKMGGVDGRWLVLGDRSPSMHQSVEVAKHVAGTLTKMVKGKVWLIFFDSTPQTIDVTGLTLDQVTKATAHIRAGGSGTSIGCGLQRMLDSQEEIDGIAIVSDGGENTPPVFASVYKKYSAAFGKDVPVYLYLCEGDTPGLVNDMKREEIDMQVFDLRGTKIDYYSIPNLVATMRTSRYSLVDEIMSTRLLTLKDVFKHQREEVKSIA